MIPAALEKKTIYLDYNATTPISPEAAEAMDPFLRRHFGNPSSSHGYGRVTHEALGRARGQVAALLGCSPSELVFTSGGTESNNLAIKGAAWASAARSGQERRQIITSSVEHPAVMEVCRHLETRGYELTILPVDRQGLVDPESLERAISDRTILVTVMHANNEVGTIQPVADLCRIARRHGALIHTDAAQSAGKIAARVDELGVDLLSVAGHKLYGPKGIGALYIRDGVTLEPLMHGAGHEGGLRPGTENVLQIVGLGAACEVASRRLDRSAARSRLLRDRLHAALRDRLGADEVRLNGHPEQRLPNTLSLGFRGLDAGALLARVQDDVAASAGAACHDGGVEISAVLKAMGVGVEWARGTVRFSVGHETTEEDVDRAAAVVGQAAAEMPRA